jgi:hypothetical protein
MGRAAARTTPYAGDAVKLRFPLRVSRATEV